jgi:CRISPR-associated exonuclease Cas4
MYHAAPQARGLAAHRSIDEQTYRHSKDWLIGSDVYSATYGLCGKIDMYNKKTQVLRERKRKITTLYDGYYLQVYAQFFCLTEMGYPVKKIELYDITQNKTHAIALPNDNPDMMTTFKNTLTGLRTFKLSDAFVANEAKCGACIYSALCDEALC